MASDTDGRLTGGSLTAAISTAVVRITAEYTGRGPTKAHTSICDDVIVVLMHDTLTKAERSLLASGDGDFVLQTRHRFQTTMREDLVTAIEQLTHRTVMAFMSSHHMQPDMAAELFVLQPATDAQRDAAGAPMSTTSRSAQGLDPSALGSARARRQDAAER